MWKAIGKGILWALKRQEIREQLAELVMGEIQKKKDKKVTLPPDLKPTGESAQTIEGALATARFICQTCSTATGQIVQHVALEGCPVTGYKPDTAGLEAKLRQMGMPSDKPATEGLVLPKS